MKIASLFQSVRLGRGALVVTLALSVVPVLSAAFAQELLPELAAPAAQHKAADEALDKQKLEAIAQAAKSYVSTLDSIEKAATAKGEIDLVAAVVKEREAVASGDLEPTLPATLPKAKLQMSRKTLLASIERINADFAKRKKAADADYLRVLATLQPKAASNPELAKQLASEKAALLDGSATGTKGAQTSNKENSKNVVVNGGFEEMADGKPVNWLNSKAATTITEQGNTFMRFVIKPNKDGSGSTVEVCQNILEVPLKAESVKISMRGRIENGAAFAEKSRTHAYVRVNFFDKDDNNVGRCQTKSREGDKNGVWKKIQSEGPIPAGAVRASLMMNTGSCVGQIDFDDIEVTFK